MVYNEIRIHLGIVLLKMRIKKNQKLNTGRLQGDVSCGYGYVLADFKTFLFFAYLYFLTSNNEQILFL